MAVPGTFERPRVTRETRRLLAAAAFALLALWVLARLRFPDRPTPNPVPPLLAQLSPPARFSELAAEVSTVGARVRDAVTVVPLPQDQEIRRALALRLQPGIAVIVAPAGAGAAAIAADRATGLMLVATEQSEPVTLPRSAATRPGPATQYLFAATPQPQGLVDVRPVYVSLWPGPVSPAWQESVWNVSGDAVEPGAFLFTAAGELVGAVVQAEATRIVVPSGALYAAAERLLTAPVATGTGTLGVQVTPLTPALAAATGTRAGMLVVHVDEDSAAASHLSAGDVITAANDLPVRTLDDWRAIVDRLRVGEEVRLRRVTAAGGEELRLTAAAPPAAPAATFGARVERLLGRTQVVSVQPDSTAAEAGLAAGDIITRAGAISDPTPAQLMRAVAAGGDTPLLVLFTRGETHHATAVAR